MAGAQVLGLPSTPLCQLLSRPGSILGFLLLGYSYHDFLFFFLFIVHKVFFPLTAFWEECKREIILLFRRLRQVNTSQDVVIPMRKCISEHSKNERVEDKGKTVVIVWDNWHCF